MQKINKENININKKELIKIITKDCNLTEHQVEIGVDGILDFLSTKFKEDCVVELRGFGKFICKNGKVRFKSFISK